MRIRLSRHPGWWPRLGGPNAVTLAAWLLTLPGAIVSTYTFIPGDIGPHPWVWALMGGAAHVLTGMVLWLGRRTVLPPVDGRPRPWVAVAVMLLAGAVRGLCISSASVILGYATYAVVVPRTVFAAWSVLIWYSLATIVVDANRRHRAHTASLAEALTIGQELAEGSVLAVRELRAGIVVRTQAVVAEQLEKAVGLAADPQQAAAQLQKTVDEVIRPLSHEMDQQALQEERILSGLGATTTLGRVPYGLYLRGIVLERPFLPWPTALMLFAVPSLLFIYWFGAQMGLAILVATTAAASLVIAAGRRLVWPRLANRSLAVHGAGVACVWLVASLGAGTALEGFPGVYATLTPEAPRAALLVLEAGMVLTMLVGLALLTSVLGQWRRTDAALAAAVRNAEWSAARVRLMTWSEQRQLGRVVHGDVQARIVSLALQLQLNPPADTAAALATLGAEVKEALDEERSTTWAQALERIDIVWRGAVELRVDADAAATAALEHDTVAGHAVAEALSESITNAVRHGGAHRISARVRAGVNTVELVVENDGRPQYPDGPPGMGSRLLDVACISWARTQTPPTTLRAVIACVGAVPATTSGDAAPVASAGDRPGRTTGPATRAQEANP